MENILIKFNEKDGVVKTLTTVKPHKKKVYYQELYEAIKITFPTIVGWSLDFGITSTDDVTFNGRVFKKLLRVTSKSITLATTDIDDDGRYGTFSTTFPISEKKWREKYGTRANVVVQDIEFSIVFKITSDLGSTDTLVIPKKGYEDVIRNLYYDFKTFGFELDKISTI